VVAYTDFDIGIATSFVELALVKVGLVLLLQTWQDLEGFDFVGPYAN